MGLFTVAESIITAADMLLVKTSELVVVRDTLWKELVQARSDNTRLVVSEDLETTPANLYALGPSLRTAFAGTLSRLKEMDQVAFQFLLASTQRVVMDRSSAQEHRSAELGNALRDATGQVAMEYAMSAQAIVTAFKDAIEGALSAKDSELLIRLRAVTTPVPLAPPTRLTERPVEQEAEIRAWIATSDHDLADGSTSSSERLACDPSFNRYASYWLRPVDADGAHSATERWQSYLKAELARDPADCKVQFCDVPSARARPPLLERLHGLSEKGLLQGAPKNLNPRASNKSLTPGRKKRGR